MISMSSDGVPEGCVPVDYKTLQPVEGKDQEDTTPTPKTDDKS